jgi:hypothetical protein
MTQTAGGKERKMEIDVVLPTSFHMKSPKMKADMLKQGAWMEPPWACKSNMFNTLLMM